MSISIRSDVSSFNRYLQLVETRLHELEALMGVLLSNPNPVIRSMFVDLSHDQFAAGVISQVAASAFGPKALARYALEHDAGGVGSSMSQAAFPNNDWQLQAVRSMIARQNAREQAQSRVPQEQMATGVPGPSTGYLSGPYQGGPPPSQPQHTLLSQPTAVNPTLSPPLSELLHLWEYEPWFQPAPAP